MIAILVELLFACILIYLIYQKFNKAQDSKQILRYLKVPGYLLVYVEINSSILNIKKTIAIQLMLFVILITISIY